MLAENMDLTPSRQRRRFRDVPRDGIPRLPIHPPTAASLTNPEKMGG